MQFQWQALIHRARVYLDDDHNDGRGFVAPADYLTIAAVEYTEQRKRWIRSALVRPATTDTTFSSSPTTALTGVQAIVGVAEIISPSSTPYRLLTPAQSAWGAQPYWGQVASNRATTWTAAGEGDNFTVQLDPPDAGNTYVVRWVPTITYPTDQTTTVDVPYGLDERLVLGIAKRAMVKDQSRSAALQDLINQADAENMFTAFARIQGDGPRVRRVVSTVKLHGMFAGWPGPAAWLYR